MSKEARQDLISFILIAVFSFGFYPIVAASSIAFVASTFDRQQVKLYKSDEYRPFRQILEFAAWTNVDEAVSIQFWLKNPETGIEDPTMQLYVMYKGHTWTYESHRYKGILDLSDFLQDWCRVLLWREARLFWSILAS